MAKGGRCGHGGSRLPDELVPEVLNYSGGGTAATAVTRPFGRARTSEPARTCSVPLIAWQPVIEQLAGKHYVSRAYKGEARRS